MINASLSSCVGESLIHWFPWFRDSLIHWHVDLSIHWNHWIIALLLFIDSFNDLRIHWLTESLILSSFGSLTHWCSDSIHLLIHCFTVSSVHSVSRAWWFSWVSSHGHRDNHLRIFVDLTTSTLFNTSWQKSCHWQAIKRIETTIVEHPQTTLDDLCNKAPNPQRISHNALRRQGTASWLRWWDSSSQR